MIYDEISARLAEDLAYAREHKRKIRMNNILLKITGVRWRIGRRK